MTELLQQQVPIEEVPVYEMYVSEGIGALAVYLAEQDDPTDNGEEDDQQGGSNEGNNPNGECPHGNDITKCTVCNSMD